MKIWVLIIKSPIRVIRIKKLKAKIRLKRQMLLVKVALRQETSETKSMLKTYRKYSSGQASKEEMVVANAQFFDVIKGLGIGVFAVLPFAPITIPLAIKLGRMVGVEILPSAFTITKPPTAVEYTKD
ncbi:hypothetical protein RS130_12395 [Paraglaciecola aquimarina]|uniref:Letm1 RBD domain-containing protein n=1 Tax=Paraglaciecola aquimarina TaxID=1235557 RepID=A0ABU3SX75_9ALTE|nr:hypothetical protein [Paraglaciecola aquimarina]MDU0354613.1 hypothetical protein [Paraglaciecola aquimarina]